VLEPWDRDLEADVLSNDEKGFTMVEMIVSVLLLAVAILALSTTTAGLVRVSVDAQGKALALQACEDRIAQVKLHPIYTQLDSLYTDISRTVTIGAS
jgi:prepilin-type N-terminal cleavage/methylation domain-containing protein